MIDLQNNRPNTGQIRRSIRVEYINISPDGSKISAPCEILRVLGMYQCPLKDLKGNPRNCADCWCG